MGATAVDEKAAIVIATNEAAVARGLRANDLLQVALSHVDGRGGGKPDLAQGGGSQPGGIGDALQAVVAAVRETGGG
jgi:alanyl-tRNA synthetase